MPRRLSLLLFVALILALLTARGVETPVPSARNAFGRGPSIVLLHGLGSRATHWLPTARALARHHRVTLVDLPGHGGASMPEPFSLHQAATALDLALVEDSAEPVVVVGHSLGGLVAAAAAVAHPERIRGLVLVETSLRPQVAPADRAALLRELETNYASLVHAAYLDFGRDSVQGERLYAEVASLDPEIVKRWIRLAWTADLSPSIARLDRPLLVVLAPRSWPHDEPWEVTAKALGYDRAPQVQARRLDGCGHFVMLDRPEELAAIIARFAANPNGELVAGRQDFEDRRGWLAAPRPSHQ